MFEYKKHRLYAEFEKQLREDFAKLYDDTEDDFLTWAMDYEIDADWEA